MFSLAAVCEFAVLAFGFKGQISVPQHLVGTSLTGDFNLKFHHSSIIWSVAQSVNQNI